MIRLRIGVHIGDVTFQDDDIYGDGINVAARLEALAQSGQVLISDTVHHSLDNKSAEQFSGGDAQQLKNVQRPVGIWYWPGDMNTGEWADGGDYPALPDKPSIAVLPFNNMSGDPEQEYFSDGITEDIITELSRNRDIHVVARNSTFMFKGRAVDPLQVASDLNARFVVEGSVRRAGRRVRVTAQLIDGATGNHVWAERYDREMEDIFELQDEITRTITSTLGGRISAENLARSLRKSSKEVDAYDLTLQAYALFGRLSFENNLQARHLGNRAIALAPDFAKAYAIVAMTYTFEVIQIWEADTAASLTLARDFAIRATSLDDTEERAYAALGFAELLSGHHDRAIESFQKAIRLNPNFADAHARLGIAFAYAGRGEEALAATDFAMRINPHYSSWYGLVHGRSLYITRAYEEAERFLRDALNSTPDSPSTRAFLVATLVAMERLDEAQAEVSSLVSHAPNFCLSILPDTQPFKHRTDLDMFLNALRRAGLPE
jgi:adenylate cyclase